MAKIIGIIGTRRRNSHKDLHLVTLKLKELYEDGDTFCSGGCPTGGDSFADIIARKTGIPILIFYAAWNKHGRGAGFKRNTYIAEKSDILIACVAEDRTGGTEDTIKKFLKNKPEEALYLV